MTISAIAIIDVALAIVIVVGLAHNRAVRRALHDIATRGLFDPETGLIAPAIAHRRLELEMQRAQRLGLQLHRVDCVVPVSADAAAFGLALAESLPLAAVGMRVSERGFAAVSHTPIDHGTLPGDATWWVVGRAGASRPEPSDIDMPVLQEWGVADESEAA